MFHLILCYPERGNRKAVQEAVISEYIPPLGMELSGSDKVYGSFKIVNIGTSVSGAAFGGVIQVDLEETD